MKTIWGHLAQSPPVAAHFSFSDGDGTGLFYSLAPTVETDYSAIRRLRWRDTGDHGAVHRLLPSSCVPRAAGSIVTRRSTTATCRTIPCVQTTVNISPPYILVPGHCRWPVPRDPHPQYQYKVIFLQLIILFTNNKESSNKRPLFLAVCLLAQFVV